MYRIFESPHRAPLERSPALHTLSYKHLAALRSGKLLFELWSQDTSRLLKNRLGNNDSLISAPTRRSLRLVR